MSWYLGNIKIKNDFSNFHLLYFEENGKFNKIPLQDRSAFLPTMGNIYLYGDSNTTEEGQPVFLELSDDRSDIEEHRHPSSGELYPTNYKLNATEFRKTGKLCDIHERGYYQIAKCGENAVRKDKYVVVEGNFLFDGQTIMLNDGSDQLFGPYKVQYRTVDNSFIVIPSLDKAQYILRSYNYSIDELITIEAGYNQNYCLIKLDESYARDTDVLSNEELIDKFLSYVRQDSKERTENVQNIDEIRNRLQLLDSFPLIGISNTKIHDDRIKKITTYLSREDESENAIHNFADVFKSFLEKYKDTAFFENLLERMASDTTFMGKLQHYRIIEDRIADKTEEVKKLELQLLELADEAQRESSLQSEELLLAGSLEEYENIKTQIMSLEEKLGVYKDIDEAKTRLQETKKELAEEIAYTNRREGELKNREGELKNAVASIENQITSILQKSAEKMAEIALDGFLANRLLKSASEWERNEQKVNYSQIAIEFSEQKVIEVSRDELANYLVEQINMRRNEYSRNQILNFIVCISQGFLTVFTGAPGTGKTSISHIVAEVLGLKNAVSINGSDTSAEHKTEYRRFVSISVERGWSSKRDFIGYFNPLTKAFDASNRIIYDSFRLLDLEARKNYLRSPFVFLLDEANLSPMEYYWADFMDLCDNRRNGISINLGDGEPRYIPETLRFLATINNDHTTEALSPRLIDRAWVITLPIPSDKSAVTEIDAPQYPLVSWESLQATFSPNEITLMNGEVLKIFNSFYGEFSKERIVISARVRRAIERYWSVAKEVFDGIGEDGNKYERSVIALDYAIAQKLLPMINGSGDGYQRFIKRLQSIASEANLIMTNRQLQNILDKGDSNMRYYQFFE